MNQLSYSPLDSERFGYRIFRGTLQRVDARGLGELLIKERIDVGIIRVPAGVESAGVQRLDRYGFSVLHADTLVYYQTSLENRVPQGLRNVDVEFSVATESDREELVALIHSTFSDYASHYHSNSLFDPVDILEGYVEWASGFITSDAGRTTWVARRKGEMVAFACCLETPEEGSCEGVLFGVHPSHAGGGLYGDLIRHSQAEYRSRGARTMKVSTQVWNTAVQKVWAREGFHLTEAFDTFHVNALLGSGKTKVEHDLRFTAEQVERFADVTGDKNPVHLSDEAAKQSGFPSRISHGMLAAGELSRIFGMEDPGPGTLFLTSTLSFLRPVLVDDVHRLVIRHHNIRAKPGHVLAVGTISDSEDRMCLICYARLLNRAH